MEVPICFEPLLLEKRKRYDKGALYIISIDRTNIYQIQFALFCCISFRSQAMKVRKNEAISLPLKIPYFPFIFTLTD